MNKKFVAGLFTLIVICGLTTGAIFYFVTPAQTPLTPTEEFDFSVGGSSDCLRFLNTTVPTVYVPLTVAANENWQLTINCTKMPGGPNGWTDVYIYEGYWDNGTDYMCRAGDLYPIINDIESADFQIRANAPYVRTFGGTSQQSYTVFFVIPPGGQSTFHVTYKQA